MAYFDELLRLAITVRNNRAPASNTADLVGGVLVGIVTALQMLLDDKQDELTFDTAPTADSQNPVTSDGIYQALQAIDLSACEKIVNKVTSINAQSTDVQYPSAKLLYDQLQGLAAVYAPKVHTHPFADIERPANVASVNAQGYTITTAYYSHVLTITADATLHLPTMQSGAAIILRLTIIQDATGGRAVTFDGGAALVFNPYQTDLSLGQANYRCWVVLWFDGVNWAWLASPYVLRAESQFAYTIDGTTGSQYVTITINGTTMQIQATSGVWQYGYNNPINSIAFTGDTGVLNVDFTNSDGLANITTLADAFKNCAALVAVDFTGCDLSNVATAADCFAGCTSLAALTIPTGTWKPDIDLSACAAFTKAAMLAVIDGLYTYASGTHTVTFNSTVWDALSQADQQQVYNAADAKGWTTNAVAVSYVVRGTSSNVNGTATFKIQYINDGAVNPSTVERVTCNVDANGNWEFSYRGKKIYSLEEFLSLATAVTTLDFSASDDFSELTSMAAFAYNHITLSNVNFGATKSSAKLTTIYRIFRGATAMRNVDLSAFTFENVIDAGTMFNENSGITSVDLRNATFASATNISYMFQNCTSLTSIDLRKATFASATTSAYFCSGCTSLASIDLSEATFEALTASAAMFNNCTSLTALSFPKATFNSLQTAGGTAGSGMFNTCTHLQTLTFKSGITMPNLTLPQNMFRGCEALLTLSLPDVTFANCATVHNMFNGCKAMTTLNLDAATFAAATGANGFVINMLALTTVVLPSSSTWNVALDFRYSPLTYDSMVYVANWLKDLTGGTAKTVTFKTAAWNALTAAEQTTIQVILSGKNWTLATA